MTKRFYKSVSIRAIENSFSIYLDDAALRTPAQGALLLPSQKLAEAIAAEWQAQTEEIRPDTMPLMRYAATAIDKITPTPAPTLQEFIGFGQMDLLAFRATSPTPLVEKQSTLWNPPLAWAAAHYGIDITPTDTLTPPTVAAEALAAATQKMAAAAQKNGEDDAFRLAGLAYGAALLGSAILSLMVADGAMGAEEAYETALLDDLYQQAHWGTDEEALARLDKIRLEIETLCVYSASIREA